MKLFQNSIKLFFLSCTFILISNQIKAQNFAMNGKTPLAINPAFTGITDFGRLGITGNKFPVLENYESNFYAGYDAYISKLKGGVGFYNSNRIISNFYRNSYYALSYAYQNKINDKWSYSLGANVKLNESVTNWNNIVIVSSQAPFPFGKVKQYGLYFTLGGLIYSDKWFLGYALADVMPNQSFTASKSNINFGRTFTFKNIKDLSLTTSIYMSLRHNGWTYMDLQTVAKYKFMYLGAKIGETGFAFQTGANFNRFRLIYSLDNSISKLVNTGLFSHEIALQVKLPNTINRNSKAFKHLIY